MARTATRSGNEDKKDGESPVLASLTPREETPNPKVGAIVMYCNTPVNAENVIIETPMVITKIHTDGNTVDGVIFNTHSTAGSMGSICVYGAVHGKNTHCWFELGG